jgi:hypothetical protein
MKARFYHRSCHHRRVTHDKEWKDISGHQLVKNGGPQTIVREDLNPANKHMREFGVDPSDETAGKQHLVLDPQNYEIINV